MQPININVAVQNGQLVITVSILNAIVIPLTFQLEPAKQFHAAVGAGIADLEKESALVRSIIMPNGRHN